jgi:hypothetical protein
MLINSILECKALSSIPTTVKKTKGNRFEPKLSGLVSVLLWQDPILHSQSNEFPRTHFVYKTGYGRPHSVPFVGEGPWSQADATPLGSITPGLKFIHQLALCQQVTKT